MMRTIRLLAPLAAIAAAAGACSRPVMYYPGPDAVPNGRHTEVVSAGAPAASATNDTERDSAAPAADADMASIIEYLRVRHLTIPVAGADMSKVVDSFDAGRDGGRVHHALDILAPRGTPILAADDGRILRMSSNKLGGITMYTVDPANRVVYYYAHMDRYNDAMTPGQIIVRGDTLGYVGTTGNAPKDTPHLHFQIMRWPADGKYWNGEPIDPYELLGGGVRK
jgi:septal ring factor EnvC (AmiA/AmiB activator)